jgi:hypothetical protein
LINKIIYINQNENILDKITSLLVEYYKIKLASKDIQNNIIIEK